MVEQRTHLLAMVVGLLTGVMSNCPAIAQTGDASASKPDRQHRDPAAGLLYYAKADYAVDPPPNVVANPHICGALLQVMQAAERIHCSYLNVYPEDVTRGTKGQPNYDPDYEAALAYGARMLSK